MEIPGIDLEAIDMGIETCSSKIKISCLSSKQCRVGDRWTEIVTGPLQLTPIGSAAKSDFNDLLLFRIIIL